MAARSSVVCDNPPTGPDNALNRDGKSVMVNQDQISEARRALGRRLAAFRQAADYGQEEFAPLVHYSRSSLANVETGRQKGSRDFWQQCDELLNTGGGLVAAFGEVEAMVRQRRQEMARRTTPQPAPHPHDDTERGIRA